MADVETVSIDEIGASTSTTVDSTRILDVLGQILGEFRGLNTRFEGLEGREGRLDSRFEGLEGLKGRLEGLEGLEGRLDSRFEGLEGLKGRLEGLEGLEGRLDRRFEGLEGRLKGLKESLTKEIQNKSDNVLASIQSGFASVHDFSHRRIKVIDSASISTAPCVSWEHNDSVYHKVTAHYVYFKGVFAGVTVAHSPCNISTTTYTHKLKDDAFLLCDEMDVMLLRSCPDAATENTTALNITHAANLRLGDDTVASGFADGAHRVWAGKYVSNAGEKLGDHLSGVKNFYIKNGEYVIQALQVDGMSGSATANGCGYSGMAHARSNESNVAVVVPAHMIKECITKHLNRLPNNCRSVISQLPTLPFDGCN